MTRLIRALAPALCAAAMATGVQSMTAAAAPASAPSVSTSDNARVVSCSTPGRALIRYYDSSSRVRDMCFAGGGTLPIKFSRPILMYGGMWDISVHTDRFVKQGGYVSREWIVCSVNKTVSLQGKHVVSVTTLVY